MLLLKEAGKAQQTEVPACEIPPAAKCSRRSWWQCEGGWRGVVQRGLSVARGATAALWTGMKFLNDSAQVRIGLSSIVRVDVVNNLVAVVVHLNFAMRANHFVSVSHNGHPLSPAISPEISAHDPDEASSPSR